MPDESRPEITPALSEEQWARSADGVEEFVWNGRTFSNAGMADDEAARTVAALANAALPDDDPRKITRADVENLKQIVWELKQGVRDEPPNNPDRVGKYARGDAAFSLAAKLAALLPPEK